MVWFEPPGGRWPGIWPGGNELVVATVAGAVGGLAGSTLGATFLGVCEPDAVVLGGSADGAAVGICSVVVDRLGAVVDTGAVVLGRTAGGGWLDGAVSAGAVVVGVCAGAGVDRVWLLGVFGAGAVVLAAGAVDPAGAIIGPMRLTSGEASRNPPPSPIRIRTARSAVRMWPPM